jgi:hypothetical protein
MKKFLILFAMIFATSSFAEYAVGDVCEDISFTTSDGVETSIYDQVNQGKAVMLFWGQTW